MPRASDKHTNLRGETQKQSYEMKYKNEFTRRYTNTNLLGETQTRIYEVIRKNEIKR